MPKLWRMSLGEYGCRVTLFERTPGGNLYREVWIGGTRIAAQKSLRHKDRERAKRDAYTLLASLKARQDALVDGKLTLQMLFDKYEGSSAHCAKKPTTQRDDKSRLERVIEFLNRDRDPLSLSDEDVERYRQARLRGYLGKAVRARAIEADLVALRVMLNWATRERNGRGQALLQRNPLRGARLPTEKNPRRPVETYDRYVKVMRVAAEVDWRLPATIALVESTGQRIGSILALRVRDIDFSRPPNGWVRFCAEHQKTGHEHWVPLSKGCVDLLTAHIKRLPEHLDGFLFPSDSDPSKPLDRWFIGRRLRWAYRRAGLDTLSGGLWHPWRRKWATERKHLPIKDVAAAGGWKETRTLLACYQQPDEATLRQVVLEAPKLYASGLSRER